MRFDAAALLSAAFLLAACTSDRAATPKPPTLIAKRFGEAKSGAVRTLVIVVNGDGAPVERGDSDALARAATATIPDSIAITVLRPGFGDASGATSPGDPGKGLGDSYTPEATAAVAATIQKARKRHPRARVILVGESGGAAVIANLAGTRPELVDGMVLVACPCTLPEWRKYMNRTAPRRGWDTPVRSLDPPQTAGGVSATLEAALIVGGNDTVTPQRFSRAYAEGLALRGISTDYAILPGKGHLILNEAEVLATIRDMATTLAGKRP